MDGAATVNRSVVPMPGRWALLWAGMIGVTLLLMLARDSLPWAFDYPRAWQLPLAAWITAFMKWLINSFGVEFNDAAVAIEHEVPVERLQEPAVVADRHDGADERRQPDGPDNVR